LPLGHLVQPGAPGDAGASAREADPGELGCRLQLRGLGARVGAGRLAPARWVNAKATDRAVAVVALQRRRDGRGVADAGAGGLGRAGVPVGVAPGPQPRAPARPAGPSGYADSALPPLRPSAPSLGAPLPLHPLRRVADQAPQRGDQLVLLRRRDRRMRARWLSALAGSVKAGPWSRCRVEQVRTIEMGRRARSHVDYAFEAIGVPTTVRQAVCITRKGGSGWRAPAEGWRGAVGDPVRTFEQRDR